MRTKWFQSTTSSEPIKSICLAPVVSNVCTMKFSLPCTQLGHTYYYYLTRTQQTRAHDLLIVTLCCYTQRIVENKWLTRAKSNVRIRKYVSTKNGKSLSFSAIPINYRPFRRFWIFHAFVRNFVRSHIHNWWSYTGIKMLELETPVFGIGIIYGQSSTTMSRNGPAKEPPREIWHGTWGLDTHVCRAHLSDDPRQQIIIIIITPTKIINIRVFTKVQMGCVPMSPRI